MNNHPKADAFAENAILKLAARLCMAFGVPILMFGLAIIANWVSDISDAQGVQRTFQATQQLEMELIKQRIDKIEDGDTRANDGNALVLQRLTAVESLMKGLAEQSTSTRQSIDNLTTQLIKERRSDAGEYPSLK